MTLKEANGKWMDIRGAAGIVFAAGRGVGDCEGGGKGENDDEGRPAGTAPADGTTARGSDAGNVGGLAAQAATRVARLSMTYESWKVKAP
jgi:hypothetical protein